MVLDLVEKLACHSLAVRRLKLGPTAHMHLFYGEFAQKDVWEFLQDLGRVHHALPLRPYSCDVELLLVKLFLVVIADVRKFALRRHAPLNELCDYQVSNLLQKLVVLILHDIKVEDFGLSRVSVLHCFESLESELNRFWILTTDSTEEVHLNITLQTLQDGLRSV